MFCGLKFSPTKDAMIGHTNLPSQCGQILIENYVQKIIDGYEAKYGEFPWQVYSNSIKVISNLLITIEEIYTGKNK